MPGPVIDHLVYATPDLEGTIRDFERFLGVRAVIGGQHVGRGTWNALLSLSEDGHVGPYLELIAPDPKQPEPDAPRPFGVDSTHAPRLVTWAARTNDLGAVITTARSLGYDPGPASAMQRATPEGLLLSWQLTMPPAEGGGVVPFLIDWGVTVHPSLTSPRGLRLAQFGGTYSPAADPTVALTALGLTSFLPLELSSTITLSALLVGPAGELTI